MHGGVMDVFGIKDVRVTRCGYTGEDGFEVRTALCSVRFVAKLEEKDNSHCFLVCLLLGLVFTSW